MPCRATREICRVCWRPSAVGFTVPDRVWEAAVHPEFREKVLCLACFTVLADERLVDWADGIEFWPVPAVQMLDGVAA